MLLDYTSQRFSFGTNNKDVGMLGDIKFNQNFTVILVCVLVGIVFHLPVAIILLISNSPRYNFKILVIGDIGVGKTSIIQRYVDLGRLSGYILFESDLI